MRPLHYVLDEHGQPVPELDLLRWGLWLEAHSEHHGRHVADSYRGPPVDRGGGPEPEVHISTVFLGVDSAVQGPPELWETMIFWLDHPLDGWCCRYTSRAAAEWGHREAVAVVEYALEERSHDV